MTTSDPATATTSGSATTGGPASGDGLGTTGGPATSAGPATTGASPDVVLAELARAVAGGQAVVLATIVGTEGSVPRHVGTRMVVRADGSTVGTIGGGMVEDAIRLDALEALRRDEPGLHRYGLQDPGRGDPGVCGGTMTVFLEPYGTTRTVFVVGAGHVGRAVAGLAHWLGYRTVAVDERAEMVSEEAIPDADVRFAGTVADALAAHPVTTTTSVVVVTRSHDLDAQIVPLLLDTPAGYIGVMGSHRRWEMTRRALEVSGVLAGQLDRIHHPIGLDIGAETVEEIAVSIMAEVIASSRSGSGGGRGSSGGASGGHGALTSGASGARASGGRGSSGGAPTSGTSGALGSNRPPRP